MQLDDERCRVVDRHRHVAGEDDAAAAPGVGRDDVGEDGDAGGVEILNALLAEHARSGGGVVLTSHLPLTIAEPRPTPISLDAMATA